MKAKDREEFAVLKISELKRRGCRPWRYTTTSGRQHRLAAPGAPLRLAASAILELHVRATGPVNRRIFDVFRQNARVANTTEIRLLGSLT